MISPYQHLKNLLSQALAELYEAGCMAEALLEEGAGVELVRATTSAGSSRRRARAHVFAKPIPTHGQWVGNAGR